MTSRRPGDDEIFRVRSYDEVAEAYERVNAPLLFDAPARALVDFAGLTAGELVLDVGTGTGAVARAVLAADGRVFALDPSLPMLMAARRGGVIDVTAGAMPDLPFQTSSFDVVLAAFVLTHVEDPDASLRDMRRVLRPGGRVALSAWAPSDDVYSAAWIDVAHEFAAPEALAYAAHRVLPGEPRFSQAGALGAVFEANDFRRVQTATQTFTFALDVEQMIGAREVCATGRALRTLLTDEQWQAYRVRARDVLGRKFPNGIRYERRVFFASAQA